MSTLTSLPNELLLQICGYIDSHKWLHSLRQVDRRFADVGLKAVQQHMNGVLLEISKESIARFQDICNSAEHVKSIKEMVLNGFFNNLTRGEFEFSLQYESTCPLLDASDATKAQVMAKYDLHQQSQQAVLRDGDLIPALVKSVRGMGQIEKFVFVGIPGRGESYNSYFNPLGRLRMLNFDSTLPSRRAPHSLPNKDDPSYQSIVKQIWWREVKFGTLPRACINLVPLVEAMFALPQAPGDREFELGLWGVPTITMDDDWIKFFATQQPKVEVAMSRVTSLDLRLFGTEKFGNIEDGQIFDPQRQSRLEKASRAVVAWTQFLGCMPHLKSLKLRDFMCSSSTVVLVKILTDMTWARLERFHFRVEDRSPETGFGRQTAELGYRDELLRGFLIRHRNTLEDLHLEGAGGIDASSTDVGGYSPSALVTTLRCIKTHLTGLKEAHIKTIFRTSDWCLLVPDAARADSSWKDFARAQKDKSEMEKLARKLGIQGVETIHQFQNPPKWHYLPTEVHDGIPSDDDHLMYDYDFGPVVFGAALNV